MMLSVLENELLDELERLGHGSLEGVNVQGGPAYRPRVMHKSQLQLVMAARQFGGFTKISVRDGLPAWAEVEVESRLGQRAYKTIKFTGT